jgi:hypothetical protein
MKLNEIKVLPKRAGKAVLQFGYGGDKDLPLRIGNKIIFPSPEKFFDADIFFLKNGKQFVYHGAREIYFGGTDENVFLTRMEYRAFEIVKKEGEKAFFEALKPEAIKEWQEKFGGKPKRQGDIWAISLRLSFYHLDRVIFLGESVNSSFIFNEFREVKNTRIFRTRHKLTGVQSYGAYFHGTLGDCEIQIAQGRIISPNHRPLVFREPHILAQTALLYNSYDAD